jgi:hypothetical protein
MLPLAEFVEAEKQTHKSVISPTPLACRSRKTRRCYFIAHCFYIASLCVFTLRQAQGTISPLAELVEAEKQTPQSVISPTPLACRGRKTRRCCFIVHCFYIASLCVFALRQAQGTISPKNSGHEAAVGLSKPKNRHAKPGWGM